MALGSCVVSCRVKQGSGLRASRVISKSDLARGCYRVNPSPSKPSLHVHGAEGKNHPCPITKRELMPKGPLPPHGAWPRGAWTLLWLCLYLSSGLS